MKHIKIHNGLRAPSAHKHRSGEIEVLGITEVALLGADCRGLRPSLKVAEGDHVSVGQMLFTDKRDEAICFAAPISGTITKIERGARRALSRIVIQASDQTIETTAKFPEPSTTRDAVRDAILESGLWTAFTSRPFGTIASPTDIPDAIFVNAVQRTSDAPNPSDVIAREQDAFAVGMDRLKLLCDGTVYLCQSAADTLVLKMNARIKTARFSGAYAAGLNGTHVHHLAPHSSNCVWCIGYQDVIALGQLAGSGQVSYMRTVSVSGSRASNRSIVRAPLGTSLRELTRERFAAGNNATNAAVIAGDQISGQKATHLGRHHLQVSIEDAETFATMKRATTAPPPIIPTSALLDALPFGVPTVPIMRALSIKDFETAQALACTKMVEEDIASLNHLCASTKDYRQLLRAFLDHASEALA